MHASASLLSLFLGVGIVVDWTRFQACMGRSEIIVEPTYCGIDTITRQETNGMWQVTNRVSLTSTTAVDVVICALETIAGRSSNGLKVAVGRAAIVERRGINIAICVYNIICRLST